MGDPAPAGNGTQLHAALPGVLGVPALHLAPVLRYRQRCVPGSLACGPPATALSHRATRAWPGRPWGPHPPLQTRRTGHHVQLVTESQSRSSEVPRGSGVTPGPPIWGRRSWTVRSWLATFQSLVWLPFQSPTFWGQPCYLQGRGRALAPWSRSEATGLGAPRPARCHRPPSPPAPHLSDKQDAFQEHVVFVVLVHGLLIHEVPGLQIRVVWGRQRAAGFRTRRSHPPRGHSPAVCPQRLTLWEP